MKKKTIYHLLASASLLTAVATTAAPLLTQEVRADDLSGFSAEKGTFIIGSSRINVRRQPSTSGEIVATYEPGTSVNYDMTGSANGYRWISYVGGSGSRNYLAVGTADGSESWGTFAGGTSSKNYSTSSSTDLSKLVGEWTNAQGDRLTISSSGTFTGDTLLGYMSNELISEIETNFKGLSNYRVGTSGFYYDPEQDAILVYTHSEVQPKAGHKNYYTRQSSEDSKTEDDDKQEKIDLSPYSDDQKLVAKVWYQLTGKSLPYGVTRYPAGKAINYFNGVGEVFPKVTYSVYEDVTITNSAYANSTEITFSDNGDGTITVYKVPKHWHVDGDDKSVELTKQILKEAEAIKLDDISDEDLLKILKQEQKFTIEEDEDKEEKKTKKLASLSVEPYLENLSTLRRRTDPDKNEDILLDYFVIDIDGNSTPELLVGRDGYIQAVYTLVKGKPELVTELGVLGGVASAGGYRGGLAIYESGEIVLTEGHSLSPKRTMTTYRLRQDNSGLDKTEETYDITDEDLNLWTDKLIPYDSQNFDWQSEEVKEEEKKDEGSTKTPKSSTSPSSSTKSSSTTSSSSKTQSSSSANRLTSNKVTTNKTKQKFKLPSTGEVVSYLGVIGLGLLGLALYLKKRQK